MRYRLVTPEDLDRAIEHARREAAVCTRFCAVGVERREVGYAIYHNGLGAADTSEQDVCDEADLRLSEESLVQWLVLWLVAMHRRQRFDLNRGGRDHLAL